MPKVHVIVIEAILVLVTFTKKHFNWACKLKLWYSYTSCEMSLPPGNYNRKQGGKNEILEKNECLHILKKKISLNLWLEQYISWITKKVAWIYLPAKRSYFPSQPSPLDRVIFHLFTQNEIVITLVTQYLFVLKKIWIANNIRKWNILGDCVFWLL